MIRTLRTENGYILLYFLLLLMILLPIIAGIADMAVDHREILSMRLHQVEARKIALNVIERLKKMEGCKEANASYGGRSLAYGDGTATVTLDPCQDEKKEWGAIIHVRLEPDYFQAYKVLIREGLLIHLNRYYTQ